MVKRWKNIEIFHDIVIFLDDLKAKRHKINASKCKCWLHDIFKEDLSIRTLELHKYNDRLNHMTLCTSALQNLQHSGWATPQRICSYQRCWMWSEERTFWKRWRAPGRLFNRVCTHCRYMTDSSQVPQLNARCFKSINDSIMWTFIVHLRAGLTTSAGNLSL